MSVPNPVGHGLVKGPEVRAHSPDLNCTKASDSEGISQGSSHYLQHWVPRPADTVGSHVTVQALRTISDHDVFFVSTSEIHHRVMEL